MGVADIFAKVTGLGDMLSRLKRDVIAYAICGVCGVVAVIMALSASILALEPEVGPVYARLIVAGVFVLIALVAVLVTRRTVQRTKAASARSLPLGLHGGTANPNVAQIAMIIEAVMLGYAMSRRSKR